MLFLLPELLNFQYSQGFYIKNNPYYDYMFFTVLVREVYEDNKSGSCGHSQRK